MERSRQEDLTDSRMSDALRQVPGVDVVRSGSYRAVTSGFIRDANSVLVSCSTVAAENTGDSPGNRGV